MNRLNQWIEYLNNVAKRKPAERGVRFSLGKNKTAPETISVPKEHLQTVISSADGAKINKLKDYMQQ